jgi:ribose 5-phosphate isomerase A
MDLKALAAQAAFRHVQNGMTIGLGTGSTTRYFVDLVGQAWQAGTLRDIVGIPTSTATANQAAAWGIPLTELADCKGLDLAVDGADQVDPQGNLIKGLGYALLREKIVESQARYFVVIVDESKLTQRLGDRCALPVEITPFAATVTLCRLASLCDRAELWTQHDDKPIVTDNGNYLVRCWWRDGIHKPSQLAQYICNIVGVVEHGLFINMAHKVIVARPSGISEMEFSVAQEQPNHDNA